MNLNEEVEMLKGVPILSKIEPAKLKLLAFTSERVNYAEGQELFDALTARHLPALDVREPHEKAIADLPVPGLNLPLSEVERDPEAVSRTLEQFSRGDEVVVYCAGGVRSDRFVNDHAELAETLGISLKSLPGGVQRWT